MNEQIRECWLKAAREDSDDKWDTQEEFIERFARLIVSECIDQCFTDGDAERIAIHFDIDISEEE